MLDIATNQIIQKSNFSFIDGRPGAGKSVAAREDIAKRYNRREKIAIATQTTALSEEYQNYFEKAGIKSKVFTVKTHEKGVGRGVKRYLRECDGTILIFNQSVLFNSELDGEGWTLFIDEIPSIFKPITIKFDLGNPLKARGHYEQRELLKRMMCYEDWEFNNQSGVEGYRVVKKTEGMAAASLADMYTNGDEEEGIYCLKDNVRKLMKYVSDINRRVYIDAVSAKKFFEGADKVILTFYVVDQPASVSSFDSVVFIGANFKKSFLYRIWGESASFQSNTSLAGKLNHQDFSGRDIKIFYVSYHTFSKSLFKKIGEGVERAGYKTIVNATERVVADVFGDAHHIYCLNHKKDASDEDIIWSLKNGTSVSPNPRGLNCYRDCDVAIHLAALNLDPWTLQFLHKFYGISPAEAREAHTFEMVLQFLCRTSIREADSTQKVIFVVGDKETAEYLARYFCREKGDVEFLDIGIEELREQHKAPPKPNRTVKAESRSRALLAEHEATPQQPGFHIREHQDAYNQHVFADVHGGWIDLVRHLQQLIKVRAKTKEQARMWREGQYDEDGNCIATRLIFLDVDHADEDAFAEFKTWLYRKDFTHVIHSTFKNKKGDIRVRVLIPMSEYVNKKHYAHITHILIREIEFHFGERIVIDHCDKALKAPFFAPSKSHYDDDIFVDKPVYSKEGNGLSFLNVREYLARRKQGDVAAYAVETDAETPAERIDVEAIVSRYEVPKGQSGGNLAFFKTGRALERAGYSLHEIGAHLASHRNRFGTGKNRDVKGVLASLQKSPSRQPA